MTEIGTFTPEQARLLWQDFLSRQQLQPYAKANYPQRRPIDDVSPHRVPIKNSGEETIPPYGCVRITGVETVGDVAVLTVEKPSSTDGEFLFNSQYEVLAGDVGWAYRFGVVWMLGNEPTTVGAAYGPIVGSWEIEETSGPFIVFGRHHANERALIGRFSGGMSYYDIQFRPKDVCEGIGSTCDCVLADVLKVTCGGSGVAVGDEVSVWDPGKSFFDMPEDLLFASSGWAHRVSLSQEERDALPFDPGPCRWEVYVMDCVEDTP